MMDPLFEVHILNEKGKLKALKIAEAFDRFYRELELLTDNSISPKITRESAIVRTKLEEAYFYAKKAMANDDWNQDLDYKKPTSSPLADATGHP
jgi:hypothetical protein